MLLVMLQIFLKINIKKKKIECPFECIMREYTNLSVCNQHSLF